MNYLGKFDAKHYSDGGLDAHSGAHLHLDSISGHAPSGAIVVPDAELLFIGDFKRSGVDLILSKDDRELVLQDYFKGEKRAVLASPDGAQLSGDLVNALTGHVEYAQAAGASDAAKIIGHVTKVTGSASALRNGVVITLNEGDNVAKGDVVQTGSDSQLGITFIDGTVFGLSSKARMVLNEMVYDPNGSNNSSVLSLVAGTISFIAGETAKHGDMKVNTPVATMGIRGTAPHTDLPELIEIDFNVPAPGGPVKFQVLTERDGHTGSYILYSLTDPTVEIGRVNQAGLVTAVTGLGQITTAPAPPLSPAAIAIIGQVADQFFQNAQQPPNPNPQTHSPPPGSTPPSPPPPAKPGDTSPINGLPVGTPTTVPIPINLLTPTPDNPNGVTTLTIPVTITVLKAVNVTPVVDQTSFKIADHVTIADSQPADTLVPFVAGSGTIVSAVGPADAPAGINLASLVSIDPKTGTVTYDPASFAFLKSGEKVTVTVGFDSRAGTDTFHETLVLTINSKAAIHWTNANGGDFAVATNWSNGVVPGAGDNVAIDAVGSYTVTSTVNETVNSLAVASGVTLDVTGGTFTVENGTDAGGNAGIIEAGGNDFLAIGQIVLNGDITNKGTLEAAAGGDLEIVGASIANTGGDIAVIGNGTGSLVDLDGATIIGGTLSIGGFFNSVGVGAGGAKLDGVTVSEGNQDGIGLTNGSTLLLDDGTTISSGGGSLNSNGVIDVEVGPQGQGGANGLDTPDATLDDVKLTSNGTIDVGTTTSGATLTLKDGTSITGGALNIGVNGEVYVQGATLDNVAVTNNGSIELGFGSTLALEGGTTITGGTLTFREGGDAISVAKVDGFDLPKPDATLDHVKVNNVGGIEVASGAILVLEDGTTVTGGTSATNLFIGSGATLDIEPGAINGHGATLNNVSVSSAAGFSSIIKVGGGSTLTLLNGTTIAGSIIDDFTAVPSGPIIPGDIDITGPSEFERTVLNNGNLKVEAGQMLTLDNVSLIGFKHTVQVAASGALLQIDGGDTLVLADATISGGTIDAFSPAVGTGSVIAGDIEVSGLSTINGGAVLNNGAVTVVGDVTLTLDDVTANGTTFNDTASGAIIQIDEGDTLTLQQGTSITGGTLSNSGTLHVETTSGATLDHVSVGNATGTIQIDGAVPSASTLLLDDGVTISGGALTVGSLGTLDVEDGPTHVQGAPDATLSGVTVTNNGAIEVGATISAGGGGVLKLSDATIDGGSITNFDTIDIIGATTISHDMLLNIGVIDPGGPTTNTTFSKDVLSNSGFISSFGGATATFSNDTLSNNGFFVIGSATVAISDDILSNSSNLQINGATTTTISNDILSNSGSLNIGVSGNAANIIISNDTLSNGGNLDVGGAGTANTATISDDVLSNSGIFEIGGASATLSSDNLSNSGILEIDGGTTLKLTGVGAVSLQNGGMIEASPQTVGMATLENVDNTIAGVGTIGGGDGRLSLQNDSNGRIISANAVLTINTGGQVTNNGLLEASAGSTLVVDDALVGVGSEIIGAAATLELNAVASGQTVTFASDGTLALEQPSKFAGEIAFGAKADILDLAGFNEAKTSVIPSAFNGTTTTLTVSDGTSSANLVVVGDHHADQFATFNDGQGGTFVVLNSVATPTIVSATQASGPLNFHPTTSAVFELEGVTVSTVNGPQNINSPDANSSDSIIVEIDAASSISVSGGSPSAPNNGANLTSAGASLALFNAGNITASGSGSAGILAVAQAANGNTTGGSVAVSDLSNTTVSGDADGIKAVAVNGTDGAGDVTVNVYAKAAIDANVDISSVGILAINKDTGNITVTTSDLDSITGGSSGINAINEDTSILASANSVIDVNASGTIHSGSNIFASGNTPAGILVGYQGGLPSTTSSFDPNLFGSVFVSSSADITADAGDGIRAFNFGTGDVAVHDNAGSITALGGTNPPNGTGNGIDARNSGGGNIVVTTAAGTSIDSGGSGINVFNLSTTVPSNSSISVVAKGTIVAGSIPTAIGNLAAGILAGYNSSTLANPATMAVPGVHGNVTIDDFGSITAAAGDDGIRGVNDGTGTVTITAEASAVITAASGGALHFGIDAFGDDGGNVSVTNFGSVTGGTDAINAHTTGTGTATIDNHGQLFGDVAGNNATFTNELKADWSLNGTSTFTGTSALTNLGAIESNGTSEISGLSNFTNIGTIEVKSGSLKIDTAVSGAGTATIDAGMTLEFGAGVAAGETVTFGDATGTLILDTPSSFAGKIAGIVGIDDVLDLRGFDAAHDTVVATTGPGSFDSVTNTTSLVVTDQTKNQSATLKLAGDLSGSTGVVTADGHGGSDIVVTGPVVAHDDVISNASAPSGDGWMLDTDNGHFYRLVTTQLSWDDAKAAAESDGAYLATITSQAEQNFVAPLAAGNRAWLGGESTDDATGTGHFFWLTGPEAGTPFGFTHWRPGEPNGGFGATEAVHIEGVDDAANGGWNDAPTNAGGRDFIEEWGGLSGQITFREGTGTTIATSVLLANDTDLNNMKLTVTSVGGQSGHSLHGGTVSLDGNIVTYAPAADFSGADSFSYTISDGSHTSTATVSFDVVTRPVIETDQFSVTQNPDSTTTISGLKVSDTDPAVSTETFTETATTAAARGSSVFPSSSGPSSLSDLNATLATGITYNPGATPPLTDKVTLTVADSFGTTDTVNFVFNQAGNSATTVLTGTAGKDVIFATGHQDILTGGGGQDQFVFKPTASPTPVQHTVTDFVAGLDKIDVRQFNNVSATNVLADVHQQNNDTLIKLDANDSVLLKNVVAANLHANDFIVHA